MKDGTHFLKSWKVKDYFEVREKYKEKFETLIKDNNCGEYVGYFVDNCYYDDHLLPKIMLIGTTEYLRLMMIENTNQIIIVAHGMIFDNKHNIRKNFKGA